MKKILLILTLTILSTPTMMAQSRVEKYQKQVTDLFVQYLSQDRISLLQRNAEHPGELSDAAMEAALKNLDITLTAAEVPAFQKMVWQSWKAALKTQKESPFTRMDLRGRDYRDHLTFPKDVEPVDRMNYFFTVKGSAPKEGYPFFIYIHGSGDPESEWSNGYSITGACKDGPSITVIPKIPYTGSFYRWWQKSKQYCWERIFRQMMANDSVNPNKMYFWGISEGGYGSQRLASYYADYLAGAGPIACGEPLINAPAENCAHLAFNLTTGDRDAMWCRNLLSQITKEQFDSLEKAHPGLFRHTIKLAEGMGHFVDYYSTTPLLRECSRTLHPKRVLWEDFAMDGQRRAGFYNLIPLDTLSEAQRTYYDMTIEGNTVHLDVTDVTYEGTQRDSNFNLLVRYKRHYTPLASGALRLCLNKELVNLQKPVKVVIGGKTVYTGKARLSLRDMVQNCLTFSDPERLYPASVVVKW